MEDRVLLAIGRVAVAAGNIEVGGYLTVWALEYGNFARTDALVHGRQFNGIVELSKRLADATWRSPQQLAAHWNADQWMPERPQIHSDLHSWLKSAGNFMGSRNRILHSGAIDEVGLNRYRPGRGHIELRVEDVEALADEGEALVASAAVLVERIRRQLPKREPVYRDLVDIVAERAAEAQRNADPIVDDHA